MKYLIRISILALSYALLSYCSDDIQPEEITTLQTIKSVEVLMYSFDENGNYPYFQDFNPSALGISIYPDSTTTEVEATRKPDVISYTNYIDSLSIFTVFYFDENHPAGSTVDDLILLYTESGETLEISLGSGATRGSNYLLSAIPQNDSIQFKITGRISDEGQFTEKTQLVILD